MKTAVTTRKFALRQRQSAIDIPAFRAGFCRPSRRHLHDAAPSLFRFVREVKDKLTPSCISNTSMQSIALFTKFSFKLKQLLDIQVFDCDEAEFVDDFPAELVKKIHALIADFSVNCADPLFCFASGGSAFLFGSKNLLRLAELFAGMLQVPGIFNSFASGKSGKMHQADINADILIRSRQNFSRHFVTGESNVPVLAFALDSGGLDFAFDFPMLANLNCANFTKPDFVVFQFDRAVICLRVCKRVVAVAGAKAGKARFFASLDAGEKSLERFVEITQRLPENLGIDCFVFGKFFAEFRKLLYLVVAGKRALVQFPGVASLFKRSIVQLLTVIENGSQQLPLLRVRIEPEFEGLSHVKVSMTIKTYNMQVNLSREKQKSAPYIPTTKAGGFTAHSIKNETWRFF